MPRQKKQIEEEQPAGAPQWMTTFSDCMTLLLTFFVLMLSFASFDDKVYQKLEITLMRDLPSIFKDVQESRDSIVTPLKIDEKDPKKGSEKPTLEKEKKDKPKEKLENFRDKKVFVCSSSKIFFGKGIAISPFGREALTDIAAFLNRVPGRIVICENGSGKENDHKNFGLPRALAVLEYLTENQGLDQNRLSISSLSTINKEDFDAAQRKLEIVILERSICN